MSALLALLTICAPHAPAQDEPAVVLQPQVAEGPVTVGDWLEYRIIVPLEYGGVWEPKADADFGVWEVREYSQGKGIQVYQLAAYETGTHEIPAIELKVGPDREHLRTITVAATEATVESVLQEGDEAPADIVGPMSLREDPLAIALRVLVALIVIAAVVALAWWLWRRRKARVVEQAARPDPPDVAALKALDVLAGQGLLEAGEIKPYYSLLSEIVRTYISARYGVRTLEETTFRVVADLRAHSHAAPHAEQFADLLRESDLVKFAKARPSAEACAGVLAAAEALVRETSRPMPVEETADALR